VEEWAPGIQIDAELPYYAIQTDRSYSSISYDPETHHLVGASVLPRDWMVFDEEAKPIWTPDGGAILLLFLELVTELGEQSADVSFTLPQAVAASVELISPTTWEVIDG
jgi:hypothetical protein